jgi:hypothetical protein
MKKKIVFVFFSAVIAAVVAAGCGGSGNESLSGAEAIAQVNRTCRKAYSLAAAALQSEGEKAQKRRQKSASNPKKTLDAVQQEEILVGTMPPLRRLVEELRELALSGKTAERVESLAVALEAAVRQVEENPSIALGKPNSPDPFETAARLAAKSGLKGCAAI